MAFERRRVWFYIFQLPDLAMETSDLVIEIRVHRINPKLDFLWTCSSSSAKSISVTKHRNHKHLSIQIIRGKKSKSISKEGNYNRIILGSVRSGAAVKRTTRTASVRIRCHRNPNQRREKKKTLKSNCLRKVWQEQLKSGESRKNRLRTARGGLMMTRWNELAWFSSIQCITTRHDTRGVVTLAGYRHKDKGVIVRKTKIRRGILVNLDYSDINR